ncbi:MAG: IS200/IS605 family transposase [Planctomycetes bacterium]|nr:IS200/IS605 family transposase [Planctomycetota bacterium]
MGDSFTALHCHIVFSTKNRQPLLGTEVRDELFPYMASVMKNLGCKLLLGGGVEDHVHLLAGIHPSRAVSDVMRDVKANSSRWVSERWRNLGKFEWQAGYGAFAVAASRLEAVEKYILGQAEHHKRESPQDELRRLLDENGIPYDPRYV